MCVVVVSFFGYRGAFRNDCCVCVLRCVVCEWMRCVVCEYMRCVCIWYMYMDIVG